MPARRKDGTLYPSALTAKQYIDNIKVNEPCYFCGEMEPCVKHFHHLDPAEKEQNVGRMWKNASLEKIMVEVAKCIVVCANCHMKIHAGVIPAELIPSGQAVRRGAVNARTGGSNPSSGAALRGNGSVGQRLAYRS